MITPPGLQILPITSNEPTTMFSSGRLRGESAKAYSAFTAYCRMGLDRSLAALGRQLGKSTTLMEAWSSKWHWAARLERWLAEQDAIQVEADRQAALERAQRNDARRKAMEDDAYQNYQALTAKIESMLSWPLARESVDGATGQTIVEPTNWKLADVVRLISARELMRRVGLGEPVSPQEIRLMLARVGSPDGVAGASAMLRASGGASGVGVIIRIEGGEGQEDKIIELPGTDATDKNAQPVPPISHS